MTDKIALTPLYGLGPDEPMCYLLEFSGCRILLDCGWDYHFSDKDISNLKKIGNIDFILISHSTVYHLGALPYAVSKLGISCPIYSTLPTLKMGLMFMYDAYQSMLIRIPNFKHFTIEDVDYAFNRFVPLKYYQSFRLTGNGEGITITPMNAGNVLGGTLWKISRESDDIYYTVDFNHKVERHLSGSHIEAISQPSLLITDCLNLNVRHSPRNDRDAILLKSAMRCLVRGGDVLLPVDAAGRSLELLLVLHSYWELNHLVGRFSLVFLSHTAKHTIDFANSMLEWMSERCQKDFDRTKRNPFDFEFLRICTKMSDLEYIPKPRVILATNPFMENGFSHDLFLNLCKNPKNLVILTQRAPEKCVAGKLYKRPDTNFVEYQITEEIPLEGEELAEYIQFQQEEENERLRYDEKTNNDFDDVVILDETIVNQKKGKKNKITTKKFTQIYPMFRYTEKKIERDDYGEFVDYNDLFQKNKPSIDNGVISTEYSKKNKKFIKRDESNRILPDDKKVYNPVGTEKQTNLTKDKQNNAPSAKTTRKESVPTKTVTRIVQTEINCSVSVIDFEGRSDGISIMNILAQISPRKLVLIHGSAENAAAMKRRLSNVCESINAPKISKRVDVISSSVYFQTALDDQLAKSLNFSRQINGYKIATLRGRLTNRVSYSGIPILESIDDSKEEKENDKDNVKEKENDKDRKRVLKDNPDVLLKKVKEGRENKVTTNKNKNNGRETNVCLFLGTPKLTHLRRNLGRNGLQARLERGELNIGEEGKGIIIKKITAKDFFMWGNASGDYYNVRKGLYQMFDIV